MYLILNAECDSIPTQVKSLVSAGNVLLNLFTALGYDPEDPPLADLLRRMHGLEGDWLILSPIHWQVTHNDALIVAIGKELRLDESTSKSWFTFFAKYLREEEMTLYYHNAETWLLHDPKQHPLQSKPAYYLLSRSLMPELAQMDSTLFWQKFITESQMLLASKVNDSDMNGLWPWGNAKLTEPKKISICADETLFSIAQLCSTKACLYDPSIKIKEQQILLINDLSVLSTSHQDELKKLNAHWYWNNVAYTSVNSNWFTRLWRKLTYAY
ncbi:MAG: hypothetical protein QM652_01905 [Legionella sp.]|uniref:hypothetical protein n=1 Tax=Legionella sp. TaxID=459 RepID=UPI0039E45CA0